MRVAMILLNQGRGSGEAARQHARELTHRGHEVAFIHAGNDGGLAGVHNIDVDIGALPLPVHEYLPAAGSHQAAVSTMDEATAAAYLPRYVDALEAAGPVDVVFGHHANLPAIAAHEYQRRTGTPFVLFIHGTGIEPRHSGGYAESVWGRIEEAIRAASGLLVTTDYVRDELVRPLVPVSEERFLVLAVGIDLDEYRPGRTDDILHRYGLPEVFVICPGALTALKGPQNVVAATAEYEAPTIFTGDGPLRHELEDQLGGRGRFLGFVPAADKALLINAATVLTAAPEKREHFGIIYVEALAAGTVPVAYGGGGVDSIVTPEVGVLTDRDPAALGTAISRILTDPDARDEMAAAGRRRAVEHYDQARLGAMLTGWLEELAA